MTKDEYAALKVGDKVYCCRRLNGVWKVREIAVSVVDPVSGPMWGKGGELLVRAAYWHVSPLAAIAAAIEGQRGILNSLMEQVDECHRSLDSLHALRQVEAFTLGVVKSP